MNNLYRPPLAGDLRIHCVSVRLNNSELNTLDHERKQHAKGEWLRMCLLKTQPAIVPEINRSAWKTFGEINHRLNEIVSHLKAKQSCNPLTKTELFAVKRQISELRSRLLNADLWSIPSNEGHAEDQAR
ncbi:hypothetical protein RM155_05890 [Pantoea agglomerans]|uniref:hypothetical protein n=1 Tax=Enterobacter agglomerans TaxID=549 RepID=UPI0028A0A74F|nr:hypothetical protein [Pantoea agglomerans]WNK72545.1 hypothetical protein RM155_05890 [Pantoea agglomerans]